MSSCMYTCAKDLIIFIIISAVIFPIERNGHLIIWLPHRCMYMHNLSSRVVRNHFTVCRFLSHDGSESSHGFHTLSHDI